MLQLVQMIQAPRLSCDRKQQQVCVDLEPQLCLEICPPSTEWLLTSYRLAGNRGMWGAGKQRRQGRAGQGRAGQRPGSGAEAGQQRRAGEKDGVSMGDRDI